MKFNVLLVGKSGAGKSSLINYLWGITIARTSAGEPETPEKSYDGSYIYPCPPLRWRELDLIIYDSWGLEAGKEKIWRDNIFERIRERDVPMKTADWMHIVLYCVSAKGARLEPFESKTAKELEDAGYTVIFVLTKCGSASENERQSMRQHIQELHPKSVVVEVNSVAETMRSGVQKIHFGKEECFEAIMAALRLSLRQCWLRSFCTSYANRLEKLKQELLKCYDDQAGYFNSTKFKLDEVADLAKVNHAALVKSLCQDSRQAQEDIARILDTLSSNSYVPALPFPSLELKPNTPDWESLRWSVGDQASALFTNFIPGYGLYKGLARTERVKEELEKQLTEKFSQSVNFLRRHKDNVLNGHESVITRV